MALLLMLSGLTSITFFIFTTVLCGTENISQNSLGYFRNVRISYNTLWNMSVPHNIVIDLNGVMRLSLVVFVFVKTLGMMSHELLFTWKSLKLEIKKWR